MTQIDAPLILRLIFSFLAFHGLEAWSTKHTSLPMNAPVMKSIRTRTQGILGGISMKHMIQSYTPDPPIQRRTFTAGIFFPSFFITTAAMAAPPVGEGGLPDGPRQFDNIVRAQREWNKLGKTVENRHESFSDEEWKNLGFYLRKLYSVGDDMAFLSNSMDSSKKTEATALIKSFKQNVKDAAQPAEKKDWEAVLSVQQKTSSQISTFLGLLSTGSVPDEL